MSRENGISSLVSLYGGPPVENPPPVVLVSGDCPAQSVRAGVEFD